jgi:hypothetical protein
MPPEEIGLFFQGKPRTDLALRCGLERKNLKSLSLQAQTRKKIFINRLTALG